MEVLLTLFYTVLFSFIVYKNRFFQAEGITPKTSVVLFNLKVGAGLALALIYTFYYTDKASGDIYKYFEDGQAIHSVLLTDPLAYFQIIFGINTEASHIQEILYNANHWYKPLESPLYNDNRTIIRFNALAHIISFGSIGVHTVLMAFLSYTGLIAMYKFIIARLHGKRPELIFAIFLLPSVLFWGSGVLKEGILLFSLGSCLFLWDKIVSKTFNWKLLILFSLSLFLLALSKIYVLIALAAPMIAYTWIALTGDKRAFFKYAITLSVCLLMAINIHWILPDLDLIAIMSEKQNDFIQLAIAFDAKSYYEIPILEPSLMSFIKAAPIAFLNVLFRPHLFETGNVMMLAAALENLLIVAIILLCIIFSKKKPDDWNLLFFCIGFVVILFTLIGMITPILGAVVRYKIPALPFLLIIFLLIFNKEKFIDKFPALKFLSK